MSAQDDFNSAVLELLDKLVQVAEPHGRYSEPKHDIVGDPLADALIECKRAKPEGT